MRVRLALICLVLSAFAGDANAQFFAACRDGSERDLRESLEAHNEHVYRLSSKFRDVWYLQRPVPGGVRTAISLERVRSYLANLPGRKPAVLFHAADGNRLCTWLLPYRGALVSELKPLNEVDWEALHPQRWQTLAVRGVDSARHAVPMTGADDKPTVGWSEVLKGISTLLLPPRVTATLLREEIDTLIVIPITVRAFDPATDLPSAQRDTKDESLARRLTLTVATIPFAALPLGDTMLVDRMSVVVAPGFFIFAQDPSTTSGLSAPIVVGDSANPDFRALPGANEEAQVVAAALKTVPLLGQQATKSAVEALIRKSADRVDYIHFATHGVADATNPLDGSFLVLNDGPWTAREISQFRRQLPSAKGRTQRPSDAPLLRAKPLVVMSACQTALGKDFDVGTTGLARAWLWAGASNVVMSLWSVDDHATKTLMAAFVEEISRGRPADQAMRQAALAMRGSHANPGYWASFGIFGAPQAARPGARTARE